MLKSHFSRIFFSLEKLPYDVGVTIAKFTSYSHETIICEGDITVFAFATAINKSYNYFTFDSLSDRFPLTDRISTWNTVNSIWIKLSFIKSSRIDFFVVFI